MPKGQKFSSLKSCKMIAKGCLYNVVRVKDLECETLSIESVLVVREFPDVFPILNFQEFHPNGKLTLALIYYPMRISFEFLHIVRLRLN